LPTTESWLRQKRQSMTAMSGSMACVRKNCMAMRELNGNLYKAQEVNEWHPECRLHTIVNAAHTTIGNV
jgi:hypothetical protein